MVEFREKDHSYKSVDVIENIQWVSATSLIGQFKEPFIPETTAAKCAKSRKSKWYGLTTQEILDVWESESQRSMNLGTWYHGEREREVLACETIDRNGRAIPIFHPIMEGEVKIAPEQRLVEGIYPEHFVFLKTVGVCGQADRIEVVNGVLDVDDYKSNKEIKRTGHLNWEGIEKKMLPPLAHLSDCHLSHYTLQLSLYTYIILKHNPNLVPGKRTISHVTFESEGDDKYGNPITLLDAQGSPIVKGIEKIEVPYYKREVEMMFDWLSKNRGNLRKKT